MVQKKSSEFRALAETVSTVVGSALARKAGVNVALFAQWHDIVGPQLAPVTLPLKVTRSRGSDNGGVLHIRIANGAAALEIQHQEPTLIERINMRLGYRAVSRLKLMQAPLPERARAKPKQRTEPLAATPSAASDQYLARVVADIPDEGLRATLVNLGRRIGAKPGDADHKPSGGHKMSGGQRDD